jgi:hypothetical protein
MTCAPATPPHATRKSLTRWTVTAAAVHASMLVVALLAGCTRDDPREGVRVDTLPGGAVLVTNPADGGWDSTDGWRVTEITRVGGAEADSTSAFGRVSGIALDPRGRLYVADGQALSISVYDSAGHRVRTIGRAGQGPGEFEQITGIKWGPGGRLWVADPQNDRYSVFDTAGTVIATMRRTVAGYAFQWDGDFDDRGRLLEPSRTEGRSSYVRHTIDSATIAPTDSFPIPSVPGQNYVITFEHGGTVMGIPYGPVHTWRFDGHEGYWAGVSDRYRLVHTTFAGDTLRIVERGFSPIPVTAEERSAAEKSVNAATSVSDPRRGRLLSSPPDLSLIPATKPVFATFVRDETGHLWVARTPAKSAISAPTTFDVFDPEGIFLGSVAVTMVTRPVPVIARDRIAGVVRDSLGTESVVVYRLDRR